MKPPLFVGIALAAVIVAAGLVAPSLRSSGQKTSERAQEQAELARRQLARVSPMLQRLDALVKPEEFKEADLAPAVEKASETLQKISGESSKSIQTAQEMARRCGLRAPQLKPLGTNVAGAKQALAESRSLLKQNDELLKAAISQAQAAIGVSNTALGVPQVLGMAEYVRAAGLLSEAEALRQRQAIKQADLLGMAAKWKLARGNADHFRGLDVAPMLSGLQADLKELATLRDQAATQVATLSEQVTQREQALAKVVEDMHAAREQLLKLEKDSFTAGDDQSFDAYRSSYLELSQKLQKLQEQEQEMRYGGRPGAKFIGPDLASAEIEGGEPTTGLEELQRRFATAQERAKRLSTAHLSLEAHIKYITESGREAQTETRRYETRLAELDTQQNAIIDEIKTIATDALTKESEALKAAEAAVRAFVQAQSGVQGFVRDARAVQQARDPNRQNERLKAILGDPHLAYLEQFAPSAEAAARMLAGRIHALRIESCQSLIDDMRIFSEMNPSARFDATSFQELLDNARTAGLDTLEKTRGIYDKLSKGPALTSWVPLATLAAAQHLTARIDAGQSATFLGLAAETIQKAVEKREQNPYLARFVQFRDHLSRPAAKSQEPTKTEKKEEGGDDFFMNEE